MKFLLLMLLSVQAHASFLPENDLKIPVGAKSTLSENEFNEVVDTITGLYAPVVKSLGGNLVVMKQWQSAIVNAYAQREKSDWRVLFFGGLARHQDMTKDGFALVVCHEMGHHLGGAPKLEGLDTWWASNEGEADYFATLKCLRNVWSHERFEIPADAPAKLLDDCKREALCVRGGLAGLSAAKVFASMEWFAKAPKFETPDPHVVKKTDNAHPKAQCRLDTYFQGAICDVDLHEPLDDKDETKGTCHKANGHTSGLRPLCWFAPLTPNN